MRPVIAGLLLGVLNAVVAVGVLASVEVLTPDQFGWYAYAPLDEVLVRDPRVPWEYVAVPLALVATDVAVVLGLARRRHGRPDPGAGARQDRPGQAPG